MLTANSADLEMTVNTLIQIDKLVQLLESPVFTCTLYSQRSDSVTNRTQTYACSSSSPNDTRTSTNVSTGYSCSYLNRPPSPHSRTD
jgi:hypothetical protein